MQWPYSAFSSSSSTADESHHHRHGTSTTNHQHLNDNDVVRASISTPHTLPLPDLKSLIKRDSRRESAANRKSKYFLPSPEVANKKLGEKSGITGANHSGSETTPGITSLDRSRNTEHKQSSFLHKLPQGLTFTARSRDEHKHGETTNPVSSQAVLPPTSKINMSHGIKLWSLPELPSQDMTPGVSYYYQTIPYGSMHNSSVHSPNFSFPKLSFERLVSRPDRSAQATVATVHPLPLPPPFSSPRTINKPDLVAKTPRLSQWQKGKLIGRGTFGSVYVGSNRETGALCAMKEVEILPDDPKSAVSIKQLEQEIDVLSQLKHPNIVQYYGSEIVEDRFYIYLEYVHPGSINKYVRDHCGGMTESIVRNFTRHIVSGLAYLHSTKTIHRDIKGANLLVDANGVVKLADFGMAKHLDGQVFLSLKGSPYWMAPELLQGESQKDCCPDLALAVDIWSLGCTIIEMMNGKPPWSEYEGPAAMFKVMKETPPLPETMSPDGKDFLRSCFIRNPDKRPTASMLLEHKFLMVQNIREHFR